VQQKLDEFNKFLVIAGFSHVKFENVEDFFKKSKVATGLAQVQVFDAGRIAGWRHLYFATLNAVKAFSDKRNISNRLAVEILLYTSGQRQIQKACEMIGVRPTTSEIAIVIVADNSEIAEASLNEVSRVVNGLRDDAILEVMTEAKFELLKKIFEVTDLEIEAKVEGDSSRVETLVDLIIERVALLAIRR